MREMLIAAAASLENVPPNEQVVLAVTLFHYVLGGSPAACPRQIVMQASARSC